jgi:hypothetical protein
MAMITDEYQAEMAKMHAHKDKWGNSARRYAGADVVGLIDRFPQIETVLDFGAGKCTMEEYTRHLLPNRKLEWTNYDPGIPGLDTVPTGRFDMVVSCDVLEHIERKKLDDTLRQLGDLTGRLAYHNIACSPTGHKFHSGPYMGQDVHLIVEPPSWWKSEFEKIYTPDFELWEYRDCLRRAKRNTHRPRATLIYERVGNWVTR